MRLYSYYRSSTAYRVRIALNLKGIRCQLVPVNLLSAEHQKAEYRSLNPQGLVPMVQLDDGRVITQSTAILEWLESEYPSVPLLPEDHFVAARMRSICHIVGCDIHPINNLRVLKYLENEPGMTSDEINTWRQYWIQQGFDAIETMLGTGPYCMGEQLSLADVYLIPQVYNALRFNMDLNNYPKITHVFTHCNQLHAFIDAHPDQQPDKPTT